MLNFGKSKLNFPNPLSLRLKPKSLIHSLWAFIKVQKVFSKLCPALSNLSLLQDSTPSYDTTLPDIFKMLEGTDGKRGPPLCSDDEIHTAEDDHVSCSGNIHKTRRLHYQKIVRVGNEHASFAFMNLPREIRNIIYHNVLTRPGGAFFISDEYSTEVCRRKATLGNDLFNRRRRSPHPSMEPYQLAASTRNLALLRTSKNIYAEAGPIIYGQRLIFSDLVALESFLVVLRPSQLSLLRHVVISAESHSPGSSMPSVFALLAGADSLETLNPDMGQLGILRLARNTAALLDETLSIAGWDAVVARMMAADVYRCLFTYLRQAVEVRGIEKILDVLDVFGNDFRDGPCPANLQDAFQPRHVKDAEWTEERKAAMKKAMDEEVERLLKEDKI